MLTQTLQPGITEKKDLLFNKPVKLIKYVHLHTIKQILTYKPKITLIKLDLKTQRHLNVRL